MNRNHPGQFPASTRSFSAIKAAALLSDLQEAHDLVATAHRLPGIPNQQTRSARSQASPGASLLLLSQSKLPDPNHNAHQANHEDTKSPGA